MAPAGRILGVDLAGTVAAVADGVTAVKAGERVSAFVHGGQYEDRGSMAEYAVADADLVWAVPEGTSLEEAATMNCGCVPRAAGRAVRC
jgi:NADPH:quinone reductase-like Zn-dependent oxidoreductase